MTRAAVHTAVAVLGVLALASCAQPGEPTVAPDGPPPTATATATPTATAEPSASVSTAPEVGRAFESQDGAVRFALPEGWSVDDRSAMGDASEMYNRGPGWLNDLVVLDEQGDQMLWYREDYGIDFVDCTPEPTDAVEIEVEPFVPEVAARLEQAGGRAVVLAEVAPASEWGTAAPDAWAVAMGLAVRAGTAEEGCSDISSVVWTGSRIVHVDAVTDSPAAADLPDTTIQFDDEQSARAWLDGAEADTIVGVLESLELSDTPILDAAP